MMTSSLPIEGVRRLWVNREKPLKDCPEIREPSVAGSAGFAAWALLSPQRETSKITAQINVFISSAQNQVLAVADGNFGSEQK